MALKPKKSAEPRRDEIRRDLVTACKKDLERLESDRKVQDAFVARVGYSTSQVPRSPGQG
jgi:hypothetical protein